MSDAMGDAMAYMTALLLRLNAPSISRTGATSTLRRPLPTAIRQVTQWRVCRQCSCPIRHVFTEGIGNKFPPAAGRSLICAPQ